MFRQKYRDFHLDTLADEQVMSDLTWGVETSNALMVGGGISKHHVIWWNQYRGGLDAAVYITTAPEHDGSCPARAFGKPSPGGRCEQRLRTFASRVMRASFFRCWARICSRTVEPFVQGQMVHQGLPHGHLGTPALGPLSKKKLVQRPKVGFRFP